MPARAGAARAEESPGTTSQGTPAASSASASSPPRPSTKGSPPLRRTTRFPSRAASIIIRWMVSCLMAGVPARLPTKKQCALRARASARPSTSAS